MNIHKTNLYTLYKTLKIMRKSWNTLVARLGQKINENDPTFMASFLRSINNKLCQKHLQEKYHVKFPKNGFDEKSVKTLFLQAQSNMELMKVLFDAGSSIISWVSELKSLNFPKLIDKNGNIVNVGDKVVLRPTNSGVLPSPENLVGTVEQIIDAFDQETYQVRNGQKCVLIGCNEIERI